MEDTKQNCDVYSYIKGQKCDEAKGTAPKPAGCVADVESDKGSAVGVLIRI